MNDCHVHRKRVFSLTRWLAFVSVFVLSSSAARTAWTQDSDGPSASPPPVTAVAPDDHDHSGVELRHFAPDEFSKEQRIRIERLFKEIICSCPKENWTKTLEGCPDGCANQQKNQVRLAVQQGISDAAILEAQVSMYGPKVLARTRFEGLTGFFVYVLPFLGLVAVAWFVVLLLLRWTRKSSAPAAATAGGPASPLSDEEQRWDDEIERELSEMD